MKKMKYFYKVRKKILFPTRRINGFIYYKKKYFGKYFLLFAVPLYQ